MFSNHQLTYFVNHLTQQPLFSQYMQQKNRLENKPCSTIFRNFADHGFQTRIRLRPDGRPAGGHCAARRLDPPRLEAQHAAGCDGFGKDLYIVDKWYLWGNLIALAVFPTAISFLCTTSAVQYIGSTPTAILGALEPVTAVFFGVAVFGETLTPRIGCGILLIILAVTIIIAGSNITSHLIRFRKLFPRLPLKRKGKMNG